MVKVIILKFFQICEATQILTHNSGLVLGFTFTCHPFDSIVFSYIGNVPDKLS